MARAKRNQRFSRQKISIQKHFSPFRMKFYFSSHTSCHLLNFCKKLEARSTLGAFSLFNFHYLCPARFSVIYSIRWKIFGYHLLVYFFFFAIAHLSLPPSPFGEKKRKSSPFTLLHLFEANIRIWLFLS